VLRRPSPEQGHLNLFLVLCHKLSKPGEAKQLVVEAVGLYQPITVEEDAVSLSQRDLFLL
jgi:hypothetical protein